MNGFRKILNRTLAVLVLALLLSGCATTDQRVDILYEAAANAKGGSGDLVLSSAIPPESVGASHVRWVLGEIKDVNGEKVGDIFTDIAPSASLMDAFNREFTAAGYSVLTAPALPAGVSKGVQLKSVEITMSEVKSWYKVEVKATVKATVTPWRNGTELNKLEYESLYSDSAATDKDLAPEKTLRKALQDLMQRGVPEIIRVIEGK